MVCAPLMIDKLSLNWNRFISSSTLGPRKNGLPNRNVVPKPIAVSAGMFDGTADRGAIFARVGEVELVEAIRAQRGEQVEVHHVDLGGTFGAIRRVAVGRHVERLVLVLRVVEVVRRREVGARETGSSRASSSRALLLMLCFTGCPSSCPRVVWKKPRRASRWQSGLPLMSASLAPRVGALTGQGSPIGTDRLGRSRFSRTPSSAAKKNARSLTRGPPIVPPNCSRWKSFSGWPSDVLDVSPSRRW